MGIFIGIEDLAANALIAILTKEPDRRFISYEDLEKYGSRVIQVLNEKGKKAILILSRNSTSAMFRNYSDFFEEKELDGKCGIYLQDGKTKEDLIAKFRGYLALDVLLAFMNRACVEVLEGSA